MTCLRWHFRTALILTCFAMFSLALLGQAQPATTQVVFSPAQIAIAQTTAWDMLSKGTASPKSSVRRDALTAFSLVGNDQALTIIENALADKDPEVRAQAINCIADLNAQSAIPKLKPLLQDKSPEVVFATARALSQLGDPSGRDVLVEVLTGERHVSGNLVDSGLDWAKQISPMNLVFLGASQTASMLLAPYAGVGVLAARQLIGDHSAPSRVTSAQALSSDESDRAIDILQRALNDHNWSVRVAAAQALGNAPSAAPIQHLVPLLHDKRREVRFVAASSIIRLALPRPAQQNAEQIAKPVSAPGDSGLLQFPNYLPQHPQ